MLKIFIGYDPNETVAFHTLANSIMRQSSVPVQITPLILHQLPLTRARDAVQSTEFTFSRFLVPWLCDYRGMALFMDCDMLVRCDIAEVFAAADQNAQISVVKHDYTPKAENKFLDKTQTAYRRKNWSSVMLFNNARCQVLTPESVNEADSSWLRKLHWADQIGELPREYNHLVGEYAPNPAAKIVHYTIGTPCWAKYAHCEYAQAWRDECGAMAYYNKIGEFNRAERTPE